MSYSDSIFVATDINVGQGSHFMRLPTEIRDMIYRHLLVAKYTMTEPNMTSKEYDCNRCNIQDGPDQTYHFDTAILGTNRKINEEARDVCRRENDFVCLTSLRPSRLGYEVEEQGVQMIAKGSKARDFWNISMTLILDPAALRGWPPGGPRYRGPNRWLDAFEDGRPWRYIFCSDELPEFCRLLLKMSMDDEDILRKTTLYLDINPAIGNGQAIDIDSNPAGLSRMERLLGPLRQLHSLGAAQIQGPLSGHYKGEVIKSICKECPTAMDIINKTMVSLNQADDQASKGQLVQANQGYKKALSFLRSCCWRYDEREFVMKSGPFPRLEAEQSIKNFVVRLQARIAAVYLESGKLRMARVYTERALDPRRPYDDRHNKEYCLDIEPWEGVAYAEVLHVAAKISYRHGGVYQATADLQDAGQLVPLTEEQEFRLEAWQNHSDSLRDRYTKRIEARRLQSQKQEEKTEGIDTPDQNSLVPGKRRLTLLFTGMFLVACNWKNKGDRLLRSGGSDLAASKYKTALSKIDSIIQKRKLIFTIKSGAFEGYSSGDAINAVKFKLQAGVAAAHLMSHKYRDVGESADAALACVQEYHDSTPRFHKEGRPKLWYDWWYWREDQKLDYVKIYYCKALALKHLGDTVRAMEHMEKALGFDPGDSTVLAQLELLRQKRAREEDADRRARARKLNSIQDLLRKKQRNRKGKARA
ncbi:MAG: hypothetical protein ALECFALPRED_002234 [Alectoria fallacina]|uniref:Uncharacterized protein n=1 Tax=Alectoria fallacina TaxID=1903189 RepID=A0A8H3FDY9_9LECA|nr:MAG: hypothetical protein ALECFALPRED_002234 [Alectoria fallacina]